MLQRQKLVLVWERLQQFPAMLRGLIDAGRRRGRRCHRFLLLGSASLELLQQSGESLAGRIAYLALEGFNLLEVGAIEQGQLWIRGGFPNSVLAGNETASVIWRSNVIRTYLERDIPQLGARIPAETLRRFWTMLAHAHEGWQNSLPLPGSARGSAAGAATASLPQQHRQTAAEISEAVSARQRLVARPAGLRRPGGRAGPSAGRLQAPALHKGSLP